MSYPYPLTYLSGVIAGFTHYSLLLNTRANLFTLMWLTVRCHWENNGMTGNVHLVACLHVYEYVGVRLCVGMWYET